MVQASPTGRLLRVGILCGVLLAFATAAVGAQATDRSPQADLAHRILEATGVKGGLIVHLGCGNSELIGALHAGKSYLVHALDTDAEKVRRARVNIQQMRLSGVVSAERFDGKRLPYADNLVNLLVAEDPQGMPMDEVMRVLAPGGVAYIKQAQPGKPVPQWKKTVKPRPKNIDEWTHYLHGADNNAVARDKVVGPPRRVQWIAGPQFARSHEINSSMAAMVSAGGRLFYIWDDNPTGMTDKRFPADWKLIARDAFNGIVLWRRPLPRWGWREWHAARRWKDPRERAKMLRHLPSTLPRRLVAAGDRVYVTLGYQAPVSVLDAASGEVLQELKGTALTDEILLSEGMLVMRVRTKESPPDKDVWDRVKQKAKAGIMVAHGRTGRTKWKSKTDQIAPLTMAVAGGRIFYCDYERIICLDLKSGDEIWRSAPIAVDLGHRGTVGTLVAHEKAVLFKSYSGRLIALSPQTGKQLWQGPKYAGPGITNPHDLFVAQGLVWTGETKLPVTHAQIELRRRGFDPLTGKVMREVVVPKLMSWGHHYRCYRSKATERFLLLPKRGIEFVDLQGKDHMRHDWLRPPCIYGVMPANGLLYVAPHQCVCYPGVLLSNFNALAPASAKATADKSAGKPADDNRLEKGPAWGKVAPGEQASKEDWPAYRRDPLRSGSTRTAVPASVKEKWSAKLRGPLTPLVVAGGRLIVAQKDAHVVRALDAETGKGLWQFVAGARVDSPPTVHKGLVLFGSADGWVYCVDLAQGREVWRFMAAPHERRITAFGQVESAWPVHGSVLVQRGVAYVTAGRSSFLDGGIYIYALDPRTGKVLHRARLDGPRSDPFKDKGLAGYMDGANSGLLVGDGADIYLFQERFGSDLKRHPTPMQRLGKEGGGFRVYPPSEQRGSSGRRLITTHGFLSDVDNEAKYWTYGNRWPGWTRKMGGLTYGQLLVFDKDALYGVHVFVDNVRVRRGRTLGGKGQRLFARDHGSKKDRWSVFVPIRVRAMVLAGKHLFVAGPPDIVPADDPLAAIKGRRGAMLWAVSAADGKKLAEVKLDAPPVFDGMAAAGGRLYISLENGRLICMEGKEGK